MSLAVAYIVVFVLRLSLSLSASRVHTSSSSRRPCLYYRCHTTNREHKFPMKILRRLISIVGRKRPFSSSLRRCADVDKQLVTTRKTEEAKEKMMKTRAAPATIKCSTVRSEQCHTSTCVCVCVSSADLSRICRMGEKC